MMNTKAKYTLLVGMLIVMLGSCKKIDNNPENPFRNELQGGQIYLIWSFMIIGKAAHFPIQRQISSFSPVL